MTETWIHLFSGSQKLDFVSEKTLPFFLGLTIDFDLIKTSSDFDLH